MVSRLTRSPAFVRVAPFVLFLLFTAVQNEFGDGGRYWIYLAKTVVGAATVLAMRPLVAEMRWRISWEAVAVGVAIFAVWIGLDSHYPSLSTLATRAGLGSHGHIEDSWNPLRSYGAGSSVAWMFVGVRLVGSSLVVPPLEEVFYRSFLYRWIANPDFEQVSFGFFGWLPFLATSILFGLEHEQWLAGVICGLAYQMLVIRTKRLGDAMTAHAITNALLGAWIIWRGAWGFW